MIIMRVLLVKLLCQTVIGWISVLECLFAGTCGCQRLRYVMSCYVMSAFLIALLVEDPGFEVTYLVLVTSERGFRGPGCVPSQVT
jgi:hypothetical protein